MANEEIVDKSPDYIRGNGRQYKQVNVDFALPVALQTLEIVLLKLFQYQVLQS